MPKNVSPIPITNDLDKTHLEPGRYQEKLIFDFQYLVSIGLHPDWNELYDWSCRNSVLSELFLAVSITGTENEAHKFSPLIAALSIPENIKLLDLWAESSLGAGQLKKLSDAIQSDGRIFQGSYVVPSEKRARRQFHHKLDDQRIAALLAERIPRSSPDNMEWLSILRMWVLTHAMERALLRNFRDIAIHSVCSKLLMALDNDEGWRSLFLSFHSNKSRKHITSDFDYLSRFISQAANGLLDKNLHPDITPAKRTLLRDLIKVSNRVHVPDTKHDGLGKNSFGNRILPHTSLIADNYSYGVEFDNEDDSEDLEEPEKFPPPDPDSADEDIVGYKNDNSLSFALQKIKGSGLHIYDIEELQYLPFSWGKINKYELDLIEEWISRNLRSIPKDLNFIASAVWCAKTFGRSFKRTLNIPISRGTVGKNWRLNPDSLCLERLPPRRVPGWHPKTTAEAEWVEKDAEIQSIQLPEDVREIFKRQINVFPAANCIGELWDVQWGKSPFDLLASEFKKIVPRVTGGMLGNVLPQVAFEKTSDATYSRLLSSQPKTALPGPCSYCSWPTAQVSRFLMGDTCADIKDPGENDNAMGSLLDPIESLVIDSIRKASDKVEGLRLENNFIEFHNAYTAYLVVALLAATGSRPISDPFEKYFHFDLTHNFVYVSDKDSGDLRQGRNIPLPSKLCSMVSDDYVSHLSLLVNLTRNSNPGLAERIQDLTTRCREPRMPFFFFLNEGAQSWKSVSESEIAALDLFKWPLPLNHFRHRLSRLLRKHGVHAELIDSICGHSEAGSLTHGDFSFRVWAEDMDAIRPKLSKAFDALGFIRIAGWAGSALRVAGNNIQGGQEIIDREFGSKARESRRKLNVRNAIRNAELHINDFLSGRNIAELEENEIDKLSRELLFNANGLPQTNGFLKYRVLLKRIERELENNGRKAKLTKRYSRLPSEKTPFTEKSPGSLSLFYKMQEACNIDEALLFSFRYSDCALILATLLCLENRATNKKMLEHVLAGKFMRLVVLNGKPHLEYSEKFEDFVGDVPARHFVLSNRAASFLDHVCSAKNQIKPGGVPEILAPIASILVESGNLAAPDNALEFIHAVADIVDQANAISMPGILAAYLAGRVKSYSLSLQDRARLELKHAVRIEKEKEPLTEDELKEKLSTVISASTLISPFKAVDQSSLQLNAKVFIDKIRELIAKSKPTIGKSTLSIARRDLSRDIQDEIAAFDGKVSSSIVLLIKWVQSLLFRKVRKGLFDIDSADRYLTELFRPFKEVAYAADLLGMDDEDITILYSNLIKACKAKNTLYFARRLMDFHRWARREFGIDDPDWSELPEVFSTYSISPGVIAESEYQSALQFLCSIDEKENRLKLAAPILLLFCYRFGLRSGEARGLLRSDLVITDNMVIILVQNNRFRELKTLPSRRQVPLIFRLSDLEKKLLASWLDEAASLHGNDMSQPFFSDPQTDDGLMVIDKIRSRVIAALRMATRNDEIVLHHARHSFPNFIGIALAGVNLPGWSDASQLSKEKDTSFVEEILLGTTGATRRKMWGISRPLGHSRRETTCGSYLHFLGSWADLYNKHAQSNEPLPKFNHAFVLDSLPRLAEIHTDLLELSRPRYPAPTVVQVLKLLRLVARNDSIMSSAQSLGISESHAMELKKLLELIGMRLRLCNEESEDGEKSHKPYLALLHKLKETAWGRLIKYSNDMSKKSLRITDMGGAGKIAEMIGASNQILLWEDKHFMLLSGMLEHFEIEREEYRLVRSEIMTQELMTLASKHGFEGATRALETGTKGFQLDVRRTGRENIEVMVESRYGISYTKNGTNEIRNSIQFIVCFIAFSIAASVMPD